MVFGRKTEDAPTQEERELMLQHLAWKNQAARRLHAYANDREWCSEFERRALIPAGLPLRPGSDYGDRFPDYKVRGERSVEAFEAWRESAGRHLHQLARHHGMVDNYGVAIVEAGFTAGQSRVETVEITGTFKLRRSVSVVDDERATDQIGRREVTDLVLAGIRSGSVQWEVSPVDD